MIIHKSDIDEAIANNLRIYRLTTDDSRQDPNFLETVGPPTILCGLDLLEFMEEN